MSRKLTPKQIQAADNYIATGNKEQSLLDAGYSKSYARGNAHKMFANVSIKSYIHDRMLEIESHKIMKATEALQLLTSIARGEEKETVIVGTPAGPYETEKEADLKTRIIAVKEILKRYPDNDKLLEAQIKKLEAEAEIIDHKAKKLTNNSGDNNLLSALADVINGGDGSGQTDIQSEASGEHPSED